MPNGRCALHGGKSTGARNPHRPEGNSNGLTHGIYSQRLTKDETKLWPKIPVGTLEDEIKLARLQLRRALNAWSNAKEHIQGGLETAEVKVTAGTTETSKSITRKRPDFWTLIDRLLGRVGKLEQQRAGLKLREVEALLERLEDMMDRIPEES